MAHLGRILIGLVAVLTIGLVPAPAGAALPVFSQIPAAGWAPTNGIVFAITQIGSTVVVGGSFTQVRNSATGQVATRNRLAAFDGSTGALLPSFAGGANGTVRALVNDGSRVYAAGEFTSIGGVSRTRVAALDAGTGSVITGFTASASSTVFALAVHAGTLYLGGWFAYMNGAYHQKLAAVSTTNGAIRSGFTASANETVRGLAVIPETGTLAVAGAFTMLGNANRRFLGSVSLTTGEPTSWAPPADCGDCSLLGVATGFGLVFGAVAGPGGRASAWSVSTGARRWSQWGDGDVQTVAVVGDTVYAGGHYSPRFGALNGSATNRDEIAAIDAATGTMLPWAPSVTGANGVWAIAGDGDALWIGGGYTRVANQTAAGRLTRFTATATGSPSSATLVPSGATWTYDDTGSDLGAAWRAAAYDDRGWARGPAQLGFGDGDEATTLRSGRLTYYLRTRFTIETPSAVSRLTLQFMRDDGVVIYLNGVEVARDNMPGGTVSSTTPASTAIAGNAERAWHTRTLDPGQLRAGENTLAVEVHNDSRGSSDISFDAVLQAG